MIPFDRLTYISQCNIGWGVLTGDEARQILQALYSLTSCIDILQSGNDVIQELMSTVMQIIDSGAKGVVEQTSS